MNGRGLTNFLLAVIAGVLLLGREAMTSGLKGLAVIAVVIFVIWLVLAAIGGVLAWIGTEWRAAKSTEDRFGVIFTTLAGCILTPLGAYALWLWGSGDGNPIQNAVFSPLGYAWLGLLVMLMAGYALVGARNGLRWFSEHSSEMPGMVGYRLRVLFWGYLEFLGGPVTFPIREWRVRSGAGASTAKKVGSAFFVTLVGFAVSLMTIGITVAAVFGMLSSLGVIA